MPVAKTPPLFLLVVLGFWGYLFDFKLDWLSAPYSLRPTNSFFFPFCRLEKSRAVMHLLLNSMSVTLVVWKKRDLGHMSRCTLCSANPLALSGCEGLWMSSTFRAKSLPKALYKRHGHGTTKSGGIFLSRSRAEGTIALLPHQLGTRARSPQFHALSQRTLHHIFMSKVQSPEASRFGPHRAELELFDVVAVSSWELHDPSLMHFRSPYRCALFLLIFPGMFHNGSTPIEDSGYFQAP